MTYNDNKASFLGRNLPYIIIAGLVVGIVGARYEVLSIFEREPLPTYNKVNAGCVTTECIILERTMVVHERDAAKYLEQSRLTAMYELNVELQSLTYKSPYIETTNTDLQ